MHDWCSRAAMRGVRVRGGRNQQMSLPRRLGQLRPPGGPPPPGPPQKAPPARRVAFAAPEAREAARAGGAHRG
eukprot:12026888-Alexandrium_andersonii.AAC.1